MNSVPWSVLKNKSKAYNTKNDKLNSSLCGTGEWILSKRIEQEATETTVL